MALQTCLQEKGQGRRSVLSSVSILKWLNDTMVVFCSEDEQLWKNAIRHLDDESLRKRIIAFAKYADLGIENITKTDDRIVSDHKQYDDEGQAMNTMTLVNKAISIRDADQKRKKVYDQCWVVFDKDDFPAKDFNEAIQYAEKNGFRVAYSN